MKKAAYISLSIFASGYLLAGGFWQPSGSSSSSGQSPLIPTAVKTTNYSAVAFDLIPVDTTGGNVAVALPAAPADETQVGVKQIIRGGTNTVSVTTGGSDVFNKAGGATTFTLTLLNQGAIFQYKATGAIWYVISDDQSLAQLDARYALTTSPLSQFAATTSAQLRRKWPRNRPSRR
jgi:hypothetical protein